MLFLVLTVFQGDVHVVDAAGGPGADFTDLSLAVAAAAEGDLVLVRAGRYSGPGQVEKGLSIVAERDDVVVCSRIEATDLDGATPLLVRGLAFVGREDAELMAEFRRCSAPVWIEDSTFDPDATWVTRRDQGGLFAHASTLVLTRTYLRGPEHPATHRVFEPTIMTLLGGSTHAFASAFDGVARELTDAPALLLAQGAHLGLDGCTVAGPAGLDADAARPCPTSGRTGLQVLDTARAFLWGTRVTGGAPGGNASVECPAVVAGEPIVAAAGAVQSARGAARMLQIDPPVREGELVSVRLWGRPGDRVWLSVSSTPMAGESDRRWGGELVLGAPRTSFALGTVPTTGPLSVQLVAPDLPPGAEASVRYCQAFVRDASTRRFVVSSPATWVVLDRSL